MDQWAIAKRVLSLWLSGWFWLLAVLCPQPWLAASASPLPLVLNQTVAPSPVGPLDANDIPTEKISRFVHAYLQVVTLIEQKESTLQAAETETESLRIEQEIEAAAIAIIEAAGLTRPEYLQLLGLANTDPEFGERVAIQLQEASS